MFEAIDNVTMVKESTGDLSRMQRIDQLSGGRLPFCNGSNPRVLDALRAGAAGWCTAAPGLCPPPCTDLRCARANCQERKPYCSDLKPLLEFIVADGLATTVKAGLELLALELGIRGGHCGHLTTRAELRRRNY